MGRMARLLFTGLAADDKDRSRQFERICQWFLTAEPSYASLLRQVWLWQNCLMAAPSTLQGGRAATRTATATAGDRYGDLLMV
jgi:predicted helicase